MDDRKLQVLRAIVTDYVSSQEPVGSKALVEKHDLGVSPATVRNDMAALEEEGYITQPHTSAGRIPTDKGYRLFVDRMGTVKPLSAAEQRAIQTFLSGALDLDDILLRTVRLLAQATQQVAIVQYPTLSHSTVRHVELVSLSTSRVLLVLITSSGRVEQRSLEVPELDEATLGDLRTHLNAAAAGRTPEEAAVGLTGLLTSLPSISSRDGHRRDAVPHPLRHRPQQHEAGAGGARGAGRAAHAARRGERGRRHRPHRAGEPVQRAPDDLGRRQRLRQPRHPRGGRSDPDGLPLHDGLRPRGRAVRGPVPRAVTSTGQ
jgi:transcriptional regulator of heat shock response